MVAAIGGIFVFVGLWMEYVSGDEKRYENIDIAGFRKLKSKERRGEVWVMVGIIIEVAVAIGFAGKDDWHARQMEKAIALADPLKQPVTDLSASVVVALEGTNLIHLNPFVMRQNTWISLISTNIIVLPPDLDEIRSLVAVDVWPKRIIFANGNPAHGYVIDFKFNPIWPHIDHPETVSNAIQTMKVMRIYAGFIPQNSKIIEGSAKLIINGTIQVNFIIPPQGMDKIVLDEFPNSQGFVFLATNSIP